MARRLDVQSGQLLTVGIQNVAAPIRRITALLSRQDWESSTPLTGSVFDTANPVFSETYDPAVLQDAEHLNEVAFVLPERPAGHHLLIMVIDTVDVDSPTVPAMYQHENLFYA